VAHVPQRKGREPSELTPGSPHQDRCVLIMMRPGPVELDRAGLDEIVRRVPVHGERDRDTQMVIAALADIGRELLVDPAGVVSHPPSF